MSALSHNVGSHATSHETPKVAQPRQIRFVPNDGQPHAKRRRINAACSTCRRRKTRCSGERPVCKTCSDNGHTCLGYKDPATNHPMDSNGEADESQAASPLSPTHPSDRKKIPASLEQEGAHVMFTHRPAGSPTKVKSEVLDRDSNVTKTDHNDKASEGKSPASNVSMGTRNRVPYFRYFGPTAIVPGFKQMVVQVKEHRRSANSISGGSPASTLAGQSSSVPAYGHPATPSISGVEPRSAIEVPFYDATDPLPNNPLITHLCETFFIHLGCNFPFLQRERFLRDLEEKKVDAILVDAVCAISARFSTHPLLSTPNEQSFADTVEAEGDIRKSAHGQPFAQRAMSAVVDTFSCPTMAVVQACLLLAYEEFGSNHDSGLWMYLGIAIRMAQDLGMQKLQGLKFEGRLGPTPKTAKNGDAGKMEEKRREEAAEDSKRQTEADPSLVEDQRASERERIDTFWAVFFLDRVISSGTGRPVTLRDKDIEISFPSQSESDSINGWPAPFPPLIRIIHLYGRASDLLNNIREVNHVTPDTLKKLAGMESDLTGIYQRLSPRLHFNAVNFQHYVKAEQGTNFILLHFWFHTLIVLLHQPTLLHSFEGRIQQLFPNSRELSMSSAKTIADILAFAELIDLKSFIGNPFTSQPTYIAACAFLMESATHTSSQPSSRTGSPPPSASKQYGDSNRSSKADYQARDAKTSVDSEPKSSAKHTLLATAAKQNYQRCYQALKSLETYWAGTKYILTVLDQKAKGIVDPLLYTTEEIDSAVELPRAEPAFTTPGWRRSTAHSASLGGSVGYANSYSRLRRAGDLFRDIPGSPMDPSQGKHSLTLCKLRFLISVTAIGWSLTGTTNSPSPNLSFLFQATNGEAGSPLSAQPNSSIQFHPTLQNLPVETASATISAAANTTKPSFQPYAISDHVPAPYRQSMMPPPAPKISSLPSDNASTSTSDAEMLLGLHSPYSSNTISTPSKNNTFAESNPLSSPNAAIPTEGRYEFPMPHVAASGLRSYPGNAPVFGDMMMIESQDVDMGSPNGGLQFPLGGDLIPWLEYLPQDVLSYFNEPHPDSMAHPNGPGPAG